LGTEQHDGVVFSALGGVPQAR